MYTSWIVAGAVAGVMWLPLPGLAQTTPPAARPQASSPSTTGTPADIDFVKQAAQGGMKEVEAGKLALEKAQSPDVKTYAQRMVDDHTKANEELMNLVSEASSMAKAPAGAAMTKLSGLSGATFDRAYITEMVADHQKTVALFEKEAKSGKSEAIKSWAAQKLPTLREHLQMARSLQDKVRSNSAKQ